MATDKKENYMDRFDPFEYIKAKYSTVNVQNSQPLEL